MRKKIYMMDIKADTVEDSGLELWIVTKDMGNNDDIIEKSNLVHSELGTTKKNIHVCSVNYIVPKQKSYKIENPFSMLGWINARKLHPLCK
ncbi:MAG: hypothetical protein ACXQTD_01655, partial [Candidatus Syntropharchaeia archaeon]